MCECFVCNRIQMIKEGKNPYFVKELTTGYVVLGDIQRFRGYTLFLCKQHKSELHFLEKDFKETYLKEMSMVAEAVYAAFQPEKLNYELLGVGNAVHMHWHIFPRRENDTPQVGPVWRLAKEDLNNECFRPNIIELEQMKEKLKSALEKVLNSDI